MPSVNFFGLTDRISNAMNMRTWLRHCNCDAACASRSVCRRLKLLVRDFWPSFFLASPISRSGAFRHLRPLHSAASPTLWVG
jgi:hypothetical protein